MAIEGIKGVGGSSKTRASYTPPSDVDEADGADDAGGSNAPDTNNQNLIAMVEQLIQAILKQLMQQLNPNADSGGSPSGSGGGASPVSGAGKARAPGGGGMGGPGSGGAPGAGGAPSAGGSPAPGSASAAGGSPPADSGGGSGSSSKNALLNEINRVRKQAGLSELKEKSSLDDAAAKNDQANNATGKLDHHNGLIDGSMGEITAGDSQGETAEGAVQQWLNSPEHREIMMNPNYTEFGGSIDGGYSTADFS